MYKFCTLEEVLNDEKEKLSKVKSYKQDQSVCNRNNSKIIESKLSNEKDKLVQSPIYDNVDVIPVGRGSSSFQVLPKQDYKIIDGVYGDIRYKKEMRPNINVKRPEVLPKPKLSMKQKKTILRHDPTDEIAATNIDNQEIQLKLQTEQDSSLKPRNQTTDNYIAMGFTKGEQQFVDIKNQLSNASREIPRPKPRELLGGSYVEMVTTEKCNAQLNSDNILYTKETDIPNLQKKYYYIEDAWEHQNIGGFAGSKYLEIEESNVKEYIHPIQSSKDVQSSSIHPLPRDELSDLLYEPVSSILREGGRGSDNSTNFTEIDNNSSKYYAFDVATDSISKERESITPNRDRNPVRIEKNEIKVRPRTKTDLPGSFFEDFSNNSELAKLGEKIRKQLESNK
ncbi:hypothetical protein LOD99_5810 [Oopsacas minuta]|uniref:Uncharacterized protein n=1 Tax=Oopsacas minuta TaxID=111878 RepID=A0AAV7JQI1_9METZ|nr:hypothetical protein LOD99_5810 [Oopsacas minuta]